VIRADQLTIGQAAAAAGTTAHMLRAWSTRYGWPSPPRSGSGYRLFSAREVEQIRAVRALLAAGRELREIIVDGQLRLPSALPPAPTHLEFGDLPAPRTGDGYDVRTRLIAGLIQRHPGIVRWAIQSRARLHPADREAAVDGILRQAAEQLGNPGWLLEAMHAQ
jgi:DNA-binding transcriptional MerR regulator